MRPFKRLNASRSQSRRKAGRGGCARVFCFTPRAAPQPLHRSKARAARGETIHKARCLALCALKRRGPIGPGSALPLKGRSRSCPSAAYSPRIMRLSGAATRMTRNAAWRAAPTRRAPNAAQTLHPVAGQGLNLGVRDACALVDALSNEGATPQALACFARRRRLDRKITVTLTDGLARTFSDGRAERFAPVYGAALTMLECLPPIKGALARHMIFGQRR